MLEDPYVIMDSQFLSVILGPDIPSTKLAVIKPDLFPTLASTVDNNNNNKS